MSVKLNASITSLWSYVEYKLRIQSKMLIPYPSASFDLIIKHWVSSWESVFGLFAFSSKFTVAVFSSCQKHYLGQTSTFNGHSEYLWILLKRRFWFNKPEMGIAMLISNNPSGDANTATGPWTTLWVAKVWVLDLKL